MTGHGEKQDRDTKVKQEPHQYKTRTPTDHDSNRFAKNYPSTYEDTLHQEIHHEGIRMCFKNCLFKRTTFVLSQSSFTAIEGYSDNLVFMDEEK